MAGDNKPVVLVLGTTGMLGHKVKQVLGQNPGLECYGTDRECMDAGNPQRVRQVLFLGNPDVVINCIGIVKQVKESGDRLRSIQINALFPHQLYEVCRSIQARLIHISTDCVFSGDKGNYSEYDQSDAMDVYGMTKYLGEVVGKGVLTLRTSIIGRELKTSHGLLEWFIKHRGGAVDGYSHAVFSGFPTVTFARILEDIVLNHPWLNGLYHVSSGPINKYDLLNMINDRLGLNITVNKVDEPYCDRSLDSTRFREATGFVPKGWPDMIDELAIDAEVCEGVATHAE